MNEESKVKLIKKQSKKTYKGKDGNDKHYYNYYIEGSNGKRVCIKTVSDEDRRILDAWAVYER